MVLRGVAVRQDGKAREGGVIGEGEGRKVAGFQCFIPGVKGHTLRKCHSVFRAFSRCVSMVLRT